jgi:predicted signal transduction protein with EAL and GGDEF domain
VVTLSIGIALYPHDGKTERELMFNADAAMYHTKHMGRNGYHFFQPSMNTLAQTHLQLMNDLWMAIDRNELRLLYQPKFHAPAGPVLGLRRYCAGSILSRATDAGPFLPLAEKRG